MACVCKYYLVLTQFNFSHEWDTHVDQFNKNQTQLINTKHTNTRARAHTHIRNSNVNRATHVNESGGETILIAADRSGESAETKIDHTNVAQNPSNSIIDKSHGEEGDGDETIEKDKVVGNDAASLLSNRNVFGSMVSINEHFATGSDAIAKKTE